MNKLISILASTVIAVSAMMTTSGTIKTSADAIVIHTRNINTLKANSSLCDSLYFSFEL